MDFLKSAVASAMAKGPPFPYTFGDKVDIDESIWTLYNGTKREDGSNCSIFSYDVSMNRGGRLPLARNALRKMRTLRHPGAIKVLDTVETESYIYIATERVVPLRWDVRRKSLSPETIKWGLNSIARTIKFINTDASSIHGGIKVGSIYTSESGEWKLGGFDVLSSVKEDESTIYTYGSLAPDSARYSPPEIAQGGWDVVKKNSLTAVDAYNFGTLIFEVFNGDFNAQAGVTTNIPPTMQASYKRLCSANPKSRINVSAFLEQGNRSGSFFDIPLIKLTEGIDNLGIKSDAERQEFLDDLDQVSDDFPEEFFKAKVLPELMKSVEFGGGGPKAVNVTLKIAAKLPSDDFESKMIPFLVRLFANPDRAIRVCLLDSLPHIIDRLPQKIVNDKIFPQLVTGFTDMAPLVREQTLKSVLTIITKLSDRTINGELLKHLAKTANDEQPGIRTNTTICLGKMAKYMGTSSRSKVLIAAFSRSLRDPFVHARNAALLALAATTEYFNEEDCAGRIIPAISPLLIDKEKMIRDQASRAVDAYLAKIRKAAESMPDTVLPPPSATDAPAARMSTPQQGAGGQGWTGWAISSFTNKLSTAAGEMNTAGAPVLTPTTSSSPAPDARRSAAGTASPMHRQALKSPNPESSNVSSPTASAVADAFWADDNADNGDDGDDDLWGEMNEDDGFGDLADDDAPVTKPAAKPAKVASARPFDDAEPDFAGWLAAQNQKKSGLTKVLPKGLAKGSTAGATKKPVAKPAPKPVAKPLVAKKIDLAPKAEEEDDGWGDGW